MLSNIKQGNDCYTFHTFPLCLLLLRAINSLLQPVFGCASCLLFLLEVLVITVCGFSAPFIPGP